MIEDQRDLIEALRQPEPYPHATTDLTVEETHISWVLLTGPFAYKIKKAVDLGFVDYTELDRRKFYCEEEVRLNRRTAPDLYRDVVPISGTPVQPRVGDPSEPMEYAVKMEQFSGDDLLNHVIQRGELKAEQVDVMADRIAAFHGEIERASPDSPHGAPRSIRQSAVQNFEQMRANRSDGPRQYALQYLATWTRQAFDRLRSTLLHRRLQERIRECHGDLHLRNIVLRDEEPLLFDCIEFSEQLRWIDVMNEIACFLVDLERYGRHRFSRRFLDRYLRQTQDYFGLGVLRFYKVYRALVRAKVELLSTDGGQRELPPASKQYIERALSYARGTHPFLAIMHGPSASGKSTVAQRLLEETGAIRVQSDVVRKHLHGLDPLARTQSGTDQGIYTPGATRWTYQRLARISRFVLRRGYSVIVDASFLDRGRREPFRRMALQLDVPFYILTCRADRAELTRRIQERSRRLDDVSEADLEVLRHQLETRDPLGEDEVHHNVDVETDQPLDVEDLLRLFRASSNPPPNQSRP